MTEPGKRKTIRTFEDLQNEKKVLREQITISEKKLRADYTEMVEKLRPALNIASFISGNKLLNFTFSKNGDKDDKSWGNIISKLILGLSAGSLLFGSRKKMFFKTLLSYGMEQALKFITEKDLREHLNTVKEWFTKKDQTDAEENDASETGE
ncbi:MAG: hypothetical protein ACHQFW_10215 [Chitinophagales bacterium]